MTIPGQPGNAVLIGEDDWRAIQETLFLAGSLAALIRFARPALMALRQGRKSATGDGLAALVCFRQAQKDAKNVAVCGLKRKAVELLGIIAEVPFETPRRYETPVVDLAGCCSRRINIRTALFARCCPGEDIVDVLCMWAHCP